MHVVEIDAGGSIRSPHLEFVETQREAIGIARGIAQNQQSEMLIHGENGRFRERNSYGNDPYPPKG